MNELGDIPFARMDGTFTTLREYAGRVLLIVNVASKCGLTPQYASLEAFYRKHRDEGFEILAFPANNFAGQEPGSNAEIAEFCRLTYDVSFPVFAKISVKGKDCHPLFGALIAALPEPQTTAVTGLFSKIANFGFGRKKPAGILWNFEKFIVNAEGLPVARFAPDITIDDERIQAAISCHE